MAVSTERMEYVAKSFAHLFDDPDVEMAEALEKVRPCYTKDAIFISPNPPYFSPEFGTILNGRDEIMKYHETCMSKFPAGPATTIDIIFGINMAIWFYKGKFTNVNMADVMLFDEDGLIETQRVTSQGRVNA